MNDSDLKHDYQWQRLWKWFFKSGENGQHRFLAYLSACGRHHPFRLPSSNGIITSHQCQLEVFYELGRQRMLDKGRPVDRALQQGEIIQSNGVRRGTTRTWWFLLRSQANLGNFEPYPSVIRRRNIFGVDGWLVDMWSTCSWQLVKILRGELENEACGTLLCTDEKLLDIIISHHVMS